MLKFTLNDRIRLDKLKLSKIDISESYRYKVNDDDINNFKKYTNNNIFIENVILNYYEFQADNMPFIIGLILATKKLNMNLCYDIINNKNDNINYIHLWLEFKNELDESLWLLQN
jgi:hypothetical protein